MKDEGHLIFGRDKNLSILPPKSILINWLGHVLEGNLQLLWEGFLFSGRVKKSDLSTFAFRWVGG